MLASSKTGVFLAAALTVAGAVSPASAADVKVTLSGADEVPAVTTNANGTGTITIEDDKTVTGKVVTNGIVGTVAHIHLAPTGKNGPPVITLTKVSDDEWGVPAGSKLSDEQYAAYQAGNLYVNVHSAQNKGGEIRGQLKP